MVKRIFDNGALFRIYGWINIILVLFLLTLLVLIFNEVYVLSRVGFVVFVGIHLALIFFIRIHYLCVFIDEENERIEFHYNKRFGWRWQHKARTTLLPMKRFERHEIGKDSIGLPTISFFKKENEEEFELGPFRVGYISSKDLSQLRSLSVTP